MHAQRFDQASWAVQARWILPIAAPPLEHACLTLSGGRIESVGPNTSGQPAEDLGNVVILPGLVNAHTHLEFSDLAQPWGQSGGGFADWIRTVVAGRRSRWETSPQPAHPQGIAESLAAGITSLGEIATAPVPYECYHQAPVASTVFLECLSLAEDRIGEILAGAQAHLEQFSPNQDRCQPGLSPHAPYSVHPKLFAALTQLAHERSVPLAFHLAESEEEIQLLEQRSGPLREMLEEFGVWNPQAFAQRTRPGDFLRQVRPNQQALWIHGNYLNEDELDLLAGMPGSSLVHCARTHAHFGHIPFPWQACRERGIRIALGTDSRASNPDLNLWEDLRLLASTWSLRPGELLQMATLDAAAALGQAEELGSLAPGKWANLAVFPLSNSTTADPIEELLATATEASRTYVRGQQVWPIPRTHW